MRLSCNCSRGEETTLFQRRRQKTLWKEVDRAFTGLNHIVNLAADISRQAAGTLRIVAMPLWQTVP